MDGVAVVVMVVSLLTYAANQRPPVHAVPQEQSFRGNLGCSRSRKFWTETSFCLLKLPVDPSPCLSLMLTYSMNLHS